MTGFNFCTAGDEELHRTMTGLIKNDGLFKSRKQAYVVLNKMTYTADRTPEFMMECFGVPAQEHHYLVQVDAYVQWAPGKRAYRPVKWMYLLDEAGMVAKYKIRFSVSNDGSSARPNPNRTELVWSRPESVESDAAALVESFRKEDAEYEQRKAEAIANSENAPSGRVQVSGIVQSMKERYTDYGFQWKMLVVDDRGFKVWTSVPKAIIAKVTRGARVAFTANLSPKNDDPLFAFGNRPTKASIVEG